MMNYINCKFTKCKDKKWCEDMGCMGCQYPGATNLIPYIETLNTDKKLMLDLLEININAVDLMAANMFAPEDYTEFERLMKILKDGYK